MSVPTFVQANQVPFAISTDGGETFKTLVCKQQGSLSTSSSSNIEESDCGAAVGLGTFQWSVDFSGLANVTPDTATEMSAKELLTIAQSQTKINIKWLTGDGSSDSNLYREGAGYITSYGETYNTGSKVGFSITVQGEGALNESA